MRSANQIDSTSHLPQSKHRYPVESVVRCDSAVAAYYVFAEQAAAGADAKGVAVRLLTRMRCSSLLGPLQADELSRWHDRLLSRALPAERKGRSRGAK